MPIVSRSASVRPQIRDTIFAELALRDGKVSPEVIQKGRDVLDEMSRFGITRLLSSILVERRLIDRAREKEVLRELGRIQVSCARCHQPLYLEDMNNEGLLRCQKCQNSVRLELLEPQGEKKRIEDRLKTVPVQGPGHGPPHGPAHGPGHGPAQGPIQGPGQGPGALPAGDSAPRKPASHPRPSSAPREPRSPRGEPRTTGAHAEKPRPEGDTPPDGEAANSPPRVHAKTAIKKYSIDGVLSSGPYGRLYRAHPASAGKTAQKNAATLALKLFHAEHPPDPRSAVMLRENLESWTRLNKERPDPPHCMEQEEGLLYLVRPYLQNPYVSLADFKLSALPDRDRILQHLAGHLSVIHKAGQVHGNLKPSNVFLDKHGLDRMLLVDPALHLLLPRNDTIVRYKFLADAPRYRSPEEIEGRDPTPASDVYSLGWIFHAAITGSHPFIGLEPPEILRRHREGPCPELPPEAGEWRRLVNAMTALDPQERPRDAGAVGERIEEIIAGKQAALGEVTARKGRAVAEGPRGEEARPKAVVWWYGLGPAALVVALAWVGFCFSSWQEAKRALAAENRPMILHYRLAEETFRATQAAAKVEPWRGRELWDRYLDLFTGTAFEGAAKVERNNYHAPVPPRK